MAQCMLLPVGRVRVAYLDASARQWLRIWVWRPAMGFCRVNVSFLVPCARLPGTLTESDSTVPGMSGRMNKHVVKHSEFVS